MNLGPYEPDNIYKGDCIELMKALPDGCIDAVITDPPYGTTACSWDSVIPFEPMWEQLKRITKPNAAIVLFGSQPFTSALIMSNIKMFKYEWIWLKNQCTGFLTAKYIPQKTHENIVVFYESSPTYNPQKTKRTYDAFKRDARCTNSPRTRHEAWDLKESKRAYRPLEEQWYLYPKSVIDIKTNRKCGDNNPWKHPTKKPVALIQYLVMTYTNENDLILDFTIGSGTTAVAAHKTDRHFIGFDNDADIFKTAERRIELETAQTKLDF